jgi:hypothetical protein
MSEPRHYLVVIQDPRGYPPSGELDPAPPEGPGQPQLHSAVLMADYERAVNDARVDTIRGLLEWLRGPNFGGMFSSNAQWAAALIDREFGASSSDTESEER